MPIEKSAGAIVFKKEASHILFLVLKHQASGHWSFPKGLIEEGESPQETAARETREETGLEYIEIIDDFKEHNKFFFKVKYNYQLKRGLEKGQNVMKIVTYFLAEAKKGEVELSHEHEDYTWLNYPEILERITYKNDKELVEKAYKFLN
jgi:8-oxo-dGTP pyrophosphatase MutT (NUDIX family)